MVKQKIEQKMERLGSVSTQQGYPHASASSSGITFSRNIHPKQPGCYLARRASLPFLPSCPMEWLWLSLMGFFCRGALTGKQFYRYPRYLLLERSLCFFGIYTFKSKLQKKASVSILSVATQQRLQTLKSPSSHPIPAPTCRIIHTFPLTNSEVNLVISSLTKGLFGLDLQTWDTQKSNPHSH